MPFIVLHTVHTHNICMAYSLSFVYVHCLPHLNSASLSDTCVKTGCIVSPEQTSEESMKCKQEQDPAASLVGGKNLNSGLELQIFGDI